METNLIYSLNPNYLLRNDIRRSAIYYKNMVCGIDASVGWTSFIHPLHAMILSFFTKEALPLNLLIDKISKELNIKQEFLKKFIAPLIQNKSSLYIEWEGNKILLPKNILLPRLQITHIIKRNSYNYQDFKVKEGTEIDLSTRRFYSGPQLITIMLTNWCVTRCKYCYADTSTNVRNRLIETKRIHEIIDEAQRIGVRQINLIGGEVFLHPDWDRILKHLVDADLSPEYLSTKMPMTESIINRILKTGYRNPIQISLDSITPHVLKDLLSVDYSYAEKLKKGILLLDKSGLMYRISSVLTTTTEVYDNFTRMSEFISKLENLSYWSITPVSQSLWKQKEKFSILKPGKKQSINLLDKLENMATTKRIQIIVNKAPFIKKLRSCKTGSMDFKGYFCSALNFHFFILPDGQVTICEQLYWNKNFIVGSVKQSSLLDVWNSPRSLCLSYLQQKDIQDSSPCKKCGIFDTCFNARNRCWADIIKAYGWDKYDYPDPRCFYAPENLGDFDYCD